MMRGSAIVLILGLSACADIGTFEPYAVEVANPVQYRIDVQACQWYAANYKPNLSIGGIGTAAARGAAASAPAGVVGGPLVPAVGALGAATGQAMTDLDLLSADAKRVLVICLREKTRRDGAALVLDPN